MTEGNKNPDSEQHPTPEKSPTPDEEMVSRLKEYILLLDEGLITSTLAQDYNRKNEISFCRIAFLNEISSIERDKRLPQPEYLERLFRRANKWLGIKPKE